jgi:hypothetical protein
MKNRNHNTVGIFSKYMYNRKIAETGKIPPSFTHMTTHIPGLVHALQ